MTWKYTSEEQNVVSRTNFDGSVESCVATRKDVLDWVLAGNIIQPYEVSGETILRKNMEQIDVESARELLSSAEDSLDAIADIGVREVLQTLITKAKGEL